jgi:hypothetical protein
MLGGWIIVYSPYRLLKTHEPILKAQGPPKISPNFWIPDPIHVVLPRAGYEDQDLQRPEQEDPPYEAFVA